MNPLVRDEGIVLGIDPQTNTSLRAAWLMRQHGRIATLLKGAQRPKSYLRGQLDLFYTCEVVFHWNPRGFLNLTRECYPRQARPAFRTDWTACATASWLCGLVAQTLPLGAPSEKAYPRLTTALNALAAGADSQSVQHWFELHWLTLLGLEPRLHRCAACGGPPPVAERGGISFSAARGGVLCSACRRTGHETGAVFVLTPQTQARLRAWQRSETPGPEQFTPRPARQAAEAEGLLGAFLRHHAELDPAGREALRAWRNEWSAGSVPRDPRLPENF